MHQKSGRDKSKMIMLLFISYLHYLFTLQQQSCDIGFFFDIGFIVSISFNEETGALKVNIP